MPERQIFSLTVNIPTVKEFCEKFPQYKNFAAQGQGKALFEFIMRPERYVSALCATQDLSLPAVAGVAKACSEKFEGLGPKENQFIGAMLSTLMEANQFEKQGKKRSIPHKGFTKGEIYNISFSGLDGWPIEDVGKVNPMVADEIGKIINDRRRKRECDICGQPLPRAAQPADEPPNNPQRIRYPDNYIGSRACKQCRERLDENQ